MGKQNMAMFENAMKMFTPFYGEAGQTNSPQGSGGAPAKPQGGEGGAANDPAEKLEDLQGKLNAMQQQLNQLTGGENS